MAEDKDSNVSANGNQEIDDPDFNAAWVEIRKILEEKCGNKPYMCVLVKANLFYASEEDKKKNRLNGKTNYAYVTKPELKKDGLSKLLIDTTRYAVNTLEKKALEPV